MDPKTVRRYLSAAEAAGLRAQMETFGDEQVRDVLLALQPSGGRPHGEDWARCSEQREGSQRWLARGLRLTKIRKLLARPGVSIAYPTLYRFAVEQLQFGQAAATIPVLCSQSKFHRCGSVKKTSLCWCSILLIAAAWTLCSRIHGRAIFANCRT